MPAVFAHKTALVTGAASGIGRATALGFAKEGARLILLDINRTGLEATLAEAGGVGVAVCADLADPVAAADVARAAIAKSGGIDYLANIAGIVRPGDGLLTANLALWNEMLAVNLVAPVMLMRVAAQDMIARGVAGRIVNVSSSSAFRPQAPPAYAATKSGILGLTRSAAAELGPHNINVNAVVPGVTRTPMTANLGASRSLEDVVKSGPLANLTGRVSMPDDVASTILYLCRPESRQITGQAIHTSAGAVV